MNDIRYAEKAYCQAIKVAGQQNLLSILLKKGNLDLQGKRSFTKKFFGLLFSKYSGEEAPSAAGSFSEGKMLTVEDGFV